MAWLQAQTTKSIDLILTDPPYGLNVAGTGKFRLKQSGLLSKLMGHLSTISQLLQ
ncbi:MAG: hypothetical protein M5U16_04595 [Hyphomicrobium sp.]|nr:hypothetical protein [Hyphomicrobium sp.]